MRLLERGSIIDVFFLNLDKRVYTTHRINFLDGPLYSFIHPLQKSAQSCNVYEYHKPVTRIHYLLEVFLFNFIYIVVKYKLISGSRYRIDEIIF